MGQPLRYVSEPFQRNGAWWREGKRQPIRVWDRLDTSAEHHAECDRFCPACRDLVPHSQRFHRLSVLAGRKEAVCAPGRHRLVPF
jgi:hypothetical protein